MARATWDTGWWPAEIYKQLLEKLGYEVGEVTTLDNPPFYQAVAQGDVDFWVNGWFPLHNTYEDTFSQGAEKVRSEEHTSELQSLMRISYAVFCLKKKKKKHILLQSS